ncbi:hypothetical protein LCGC14_0974250, partial [marine sediment metagenome]
MGRISEAVDCAHRSVQYADDSGDEFERLSDRGTLADVLHQAGRVKEAQSLFTEAEEMQKAHQPEFPL